MMPYLIDGHNLIPKIPGLALQSVDDENQLITLLQEFCRKTRKRAEVYFDNLPAGQPKARNYGSVIARFIRQGRTADAAIRDRLSRLGPAAKNWTVVSSDHEVQAAARAVRARVMQSETFAKKLVQTLEQVESQAPEEEGILSSEEVDEWLDLFGSQEENEDPGP
jgi:predicted RNA-binding protein with PIN domain